MSNMHDLLVKSWRLFSIFISAIMIISFFQLTTAMAADILVSPLPIYPTNFQETNPISDPPLGIPSFKWSVVLGAITYRLQVDSEAGFNQPMALDLTTRNTSYTPQSGGQLFVDGDWYWRVRVEDPAGDWSSVMRFTKRWATNDNKPALLEPIDGADLTFFNSPNFTWMPVTGASKYRFQIASDPGFTAIVYTVETISTTTQPNNRLVNGRYYWRVIPMDAVDHLGTTSVIRFFDMVYGTGAMIPTLLSPVDESFPVFTPTFHWTAVEGAQNYRLEYTSDETCDFNVGTSLVVRQTSYVPTDTFPNDYRYCWRVRVESTPAVGDWSATWHFQKKWYLQPVLLTPTNLYQGALYPLYSWTPVPGAASYNIQIALDPSFNQIIDQGTTANTTYSPQAYYGNAHYWWRVTPYDGGSKMGLASSVGEFDGYYDSLSPILIYPLHYYLPNNYGDYTMNPYEDRTVAFPIFMWHKVMNPAPNGGTFIGAYRIQLDDDPYFEPPLAWEYVTENTSATPTINDEFNPVNNKDYYWRVCPLDENRELCLLNPHTGNPWWSQKWRTRFNDSLALQPTDGVAPPVLLRPAHGQEIVEATPLLEWWPLDGATQYQVEISRDISFALENIEITETVAIPAYSPVYSIAQRIWDRTDYGTFYWRVRGYVADSWGDWSLPWRFQIASQSEWRTTRGLGNSANQLLIGSDPGDDAVAPYNLTTLFASQADGLWYLGFNATNTTSNMTYMFYIDLDHIDGSGATLPPERGYPVTTISAHQPEYAIYVDRINGVIDASHTWVFAWNSINHVWEYGQRVNEITNGAVYASNNYVEIRLPNGAIGMSQVTGSASIMLVSINTGTFVLVDSVPSDPGVPGNGSLSRFSAVSDRMNLISPPNIVSGDPSLMRSLLPFFWDWPSGGNSSNPFIGARLEVHLDAKYTNQVATIDMGSNTCYFGTNHGTLTSDIVGDNIYYWRIQPKYCNPGHPIANGAWASGWSFHRIGLTAQNLQVYVNLSTPTFTWDMAEGASNYLLQVDDDENFGSLAIGQNTPMNSFTPQDTLSEGTYYWRVRVNRHGGIGNDWSDTKIFTITMPTPENLVPNNEVVQYTPTFCWDSVTGNATVYGNLDQVLTAWRYRGQVSQDPSFSNIYDSFETFNNCWTPTFGYQDGKYYWRVAMIDGNGRMGAYSTYATFDKLYPVTTLNSPVNKNVLDTPTFNWDPVDGATTYLLEVSRFTSFYPLYESMETINTEYTPTWSYTRDQSYYWRVAIRDRNGKLGPYTHYARFVIGEVYPVFVPIIQK